MENDPESFKPELVCRFPPEVSADWRLLVQSIAVFCERLRTWAQENQPLLKGIIALAPRIQNLPEKIGRIGELGWTVGTPMQARDLLILVEINKRSEADAYMPAKYEESDNDLVNVEARLSSVSQLESFRPVLTQCFAAYRRGDYAIAIPCLIAILEHSVHYLSPLPNFTSTDIAKIAKQAYRKSPHGSATVLTAWPLCEYVQALYQQYLPGQSSDDQVFRNGIVNGNQASPNERVEVIRLFHAICSVIGLYERQSRSN